MECRYALAMAERQERQARAHDALTDQRARALVSHTLRHLFLADSRPDAELTENYPDAMTQSSMVVTRRDTTLTHSGNVVRVLAKVGRKKGSCLPVSTTRPDLGAELMPQPGLLPVVVRGSTP